MSSPELTLFSYEILGLVGRDGAAPHDLRRMVENGRMLNWAGESQYYSEPKRLAKLGYLEARREPGKTRERTVYSLTDKGLEALREYARTPVHFTPLKSEPLLRRDAHRPGRRGGHARGDAHPPRRPRRHRRAPGGRRRSGPRRSPTGRSTCGS